MKDNATSGPVFVSLLEAFRASGGTAPGDIVSRLLEDHQAGEVASLARLVHSSQIFGFDWRGSFWIPMFQFNENELSIAVAPQAVRAELPDLWSGWTVAMWFAMPNALLEGQRPVDLLRTEFDAVLNAAKVLRSMAGMSFIAGRPTHNHVAHA